MALVAWVAVSVERWAAPWLVKRDAVRLVGVNPPLAAVDRLTVTVRFCAGETTAPMVTLWNGASVALSLTAWLAAVPVMVGGSPIAVVTTVVVVSLVAAMPSSAVMVKVVVTVLPGATWLFVGSNTSCRMALLAWVA